jgi:hypothetical protein
MGFCACQIICDHLIFPRHALDLVGTVCKDGRKKMLSSVEEIEQMANADIHNKNNSTGYSNQSSPSSNNGDGYNSSPLILVRRPNT